jgi:GH24 family phage-related lysozyme (muramidase)
MLNTMSTKPIIGLHHVTAIASDPQRNRSNPNFANSYLANDEPIIVRNTGPERARIRAPKSNRSISQDAIDLIIACEVSSEVLYRQRYYKPVWPKGQSGVTIGIGYDLGASSEKEFLEDWGSYLNSEQVKNLAQVCGKTAGAASSALKKLEPVSISWDVASTQCRLETLPRYIGATERALPNCSALNSVCMGALVSLVYNRGPAFDRTEPRFKEMWQVADHMKSKNFEAIPRDIRSMKRLWDKQSFKGIVLRREAEAALFQYGLIAGSTTPAV